MTGTCAGTAVRTVRAMNAEHITGTRVADPVARRINVCVPGASESQYSNPWAAVRYGTPSAARPGPSIANGYVAPKSTTRHPASATACSIRRSISRTSSM